MHCDDFSAVSLPQLHAAGSWQQQYKLIIQWGKLVKSKPDIRVAENLIRGCEVPVWLAYELKEGRLYFAFDADSSVLKGLVALLLAQLQGRAQAELAALDLTQNFTGLGLEKHLTPSRNNGLHAIIARLQSWISYAH